MRYLLPAAFLCAFLAWLTTLGPTLGEQGMVSGSEHDVAASAFPSGVSVCETCHLPHDASGESLWGQGPRPTEESFSGSAPLCYSCHDGTVTSAGAYVFDSDAGQHPTTPGKVSEDCDMCHDAHVPDYGNFILFPSAANLCRACHARSYDRFHSSNVDAAAAGYAPVDDSWNPNEGDFSGSRLWGADGLQRGDYLKCLSCHAAHGAVSDTSLLTMRYRDETSTVSPLCRNCHR